MTADFAATLERWGESAPRLPGWNVELLLASASPRRHALLQFLGLEFEIRPPKRPEPLASAFCDVESYVLATATSKALEIGGSMGLDGAATPRGGPPNRPIWILAADTVASVQNEVLGKPKDRADAKRILGRLVGVPHHTWTGVALYLPVRQIMLSAAACTHVVMRRVSDAAVEAYLDSNAWEGKAGAYGIQEEDDPFVEHIDGSFSNVVGLPLSVVGRLLKTAGGIEFNHSSDGSSDNSIDIGATP